ncbi:adenosine kinase [Dysgonomonas sp. 25]|uniref:adenosine kinase n=1 Tax=Dysgonomonas sp. 25 TaxID=2302933 RepID=UPI0013D813AA|nr:adenosine kinase [Dysgonomonas sp. 25]NDV68987.1 adenosine kinase [Dysgonomonas sp. 25]
MKVLGMGNALVDVLARIADDKLLETLNLPKGSMQLIDEKRFAELSDEIQKLNAEVVSGGSAANTIVGLACLDIKTGFIGRIGKDTFGKRYRDDLLKYGVAPLLSEVDETSGVATTFISQDGERTFGTYLGAAALLHANELDKQQFEGYDYFYIEGYLVQSYDLIRQAIYMAKEAGLKVILDFASYNVVEESKDFLLEIIPSQVDIVFANEEEAKSLYGKDVTPEEAVSRLAEMVEVAIVKAGANGSWAQRGKEKVFIPAREVDCVDTTGAGDLYASGFMYGLIHDLSLEKCGLIGALLAENVIQVIGPKITEQQWAAIKPKIQEIIAD